MRDAALASLRRADKRVGRREDAIAKDLTRIADARALAAQASWIVAEAKKVPRGATTMTYVDYADGEPHERIIELDPARTAREQLDDIFRHARRLREGEGVARARLDETQAIRRAISQATTAVMAADTDEALALAVAGALRAAPHDVRTPQVPGAKRAQDVARPPFRAFAGDGGRVLVGRGAAHNDELTFHVAKPYHLWLHARGVPGAHVVVPLRRDKSCPAELLIDAGHLAAHFSDARDEPVVEVTYVPRKYVRKPRRSAPGAVVVDREKVLTLRVEEDRLARLLRAEEPWPG